VISIVVLCSSIKMDTPEIIEKMSKYRRLSDKSHLLVSMMNGSRLTFLIQVFLAALLCSVVRIRGNEDLFVAVRADDSSAIAQAIDAGVDLNSIGSGGQTPLMHAVLTGKKKAVIELLQKGADATIGEKDGYTPMHGAGFQGRSEIAHVLVKHGLDPSDRHADGYTPLHRACWGREQRHTDTVHVLLMAGVSPLEESSSGQSPLEMAHNNPPTQALLRKWIEKEDHRTEL
jgi:hypothetical protein